MNISLKKHSAKLCEILYAPEFNDKEECDVGVHACNNIIYHDSIAAGESPVKITCGKYLKNIE